MGRLIFISKKWRPTSANINKLPQPLRQYIHDLETMADPAHLAAENTLLRDEVHYMAQMIRKCGGSPMGAMYELIKEWRGDNE